MSAASSFKLETFAAHGLARKIIVSAALLAAAALIFNDSIASYFNIQSFITKRGEALYSASFTFLSIFWAAMLTIWSMLKTRATRYVERLADNAIFLAFVKSLEVRLLIGLLCIMISIFLYVALPQIEDYVLVNIFPIWIFFQILSLTLLIDSLITARILLS